MTSPILISASYDRKILFWNVACRRIVRSMLFEESQVNCLHLCMDNRYLIVGGSSCIRVYDLVADSTKDSLGYPAIVSVARFDCSNTTNFTSIGSFRLLREACESGFMIGLEESSADLYASFIGLHAPADADVHLVLYTTSEDGYIRFFDGRFSGPLRLLKTIRTGASITCSALSPDFRFLLTGSQIGQVSVWHLPSVIDSISIDMKRANGNTNSRSQGLSRTYSALEGSNMDVEIREVQDRLGSAEMFGSRPLQTISFENDYSAVRSVSMSAVGWWGVAATHCGNLHFIGLSHFASISSRESPKVNAASEPEKEIGQAPSATLTTLNSNRKGPEDGGTRVRLSTYASALEANNQKNSMRGSDVENGLRSSTASPETLGVSGKSGANDHAAAQAIDAEQKLLAVKKTSEPASDNGFSKKTALQKELEMEVFHSFQAHYKYILKVALSPNNALLATCSADYSVGRFVIPKPLQEWRMSASTKRSASAISVAGSGPMDPLPSGIVGIVDGEEKEELRSEASLNSVRGATKEAGGDVEGGDKEDFNSNENQRENAVHTDPQSLDFSNAPFDGASGPASTAPDGVDGNAKSADTEPLTGALSTIHFKTLKPLTGHARWVWDCVFSACSSFLFSASSDSSIRMWESIFESDNCTSTPFAEGHKKPVIVLLLFQEKRKLPGSQ